MTDLRNYLFMVAFALVLTGCASTPLYDANKTPTASNLEKLTNQHHFAILGKLGFRNDTEAFSVAINRWQQDEDSYLIELSSTFLGLGSVKITGTPIWIEVSESGEPPIQSYYPNEILLELLGMPLPVEHFNYWLRGIPSPLAEYRSNWDQRGLLSDLHQDGWDIKFDLHLEVEGLPLPGRLKLSQQTTTITLVIKEWSLL